MNLRNRPDDIAQEMKPYEKQKALIMGLVLAANAECVCVAVRGLAIFNNWLSISQVSIPSKVR